MEKANVLLQQFDDATKRLAEALEQEKNAFMRDSAIQRFEIAFDLAWKMLKIFLEAEHGIVCQSPKKCFREGFSQEILSYDTSWITMTDDRNATSHLYKESMANEVYSRLPSYLHLFQQLIQAVQKNET